MQTIYEGKGIGKQREFYTDSDEWTTLKTVDETQLRRVHTESNGQGKLEICCRQSSLER